MLLLIQSPCVSVVRYACVSWDGLKVIDVTRSNWAPVNFVHELPRFVVLYNPPSPLGAPPHPLNTQTYHVFCRGSEGSITMSFVQYCMPGSETSDHEFPMGL